MILGEVRWVELAARGGHAQQGRRPAVILQHQKVS
ncbi:MAG: type II toxin-antitoxin system PemK/MazF family toxin, partial [Pyrinomonadaceae bacterium]